VVHHLPHLLLDMLAVVAAQQKLDILETILLELLEKVVWV
jgi:hypothetical protein